MIEEIILNMASKYPFVLTALVIIGGLRVIFKPLMSYIESYVLSTESLEDDKFLKSLKENKFYQAFVFLLDYTASIKLPQKKK